MPNGIKFEPLAKLIQLNSGERITKLHNAGSLYPVYGGGGESFRTDEFNRQNEYVISRFAMSKECVRKVNGKFWLLDSGFTFNPLNNSISKDYIAYWLLNSQDRIFSCTSQGAQKNLNTKGFLAFRVPVPPLRIQEEIVRILDSFTSLEAELETELGARQKQYEYYRNRLLTFQELDHSRINDLIRELCPGGIVYKPLSNLLNYEQPTKYIVNTTDYDSTPGVPVLTPGQTFILGYTKETDNIFQADKTNPTIIFDDFTTDFKWVDFPFKVKSSAMKMLSSRGEISLRFAWYAMQTIRYIPQNHARQWIKNYSAFEIPVPPMPVQNKIVGILDIFTSLKAELEAGLEARRKQYEYYRDRLLTFKELDHE